LCVMRFDCDSHNSHRIAHTWHGHGHQPLIADCRLDHPRSHAVDHRSDRRHTLQHYNSQGWPLMHVSTGVG
jgi:hypothetical protein